MDVQNKVNSALKEIFRPEFLNRIDEIVIFNHLTEEELIEICSLMLEDLKEGLKEKDIKISFSEELKAYIAKKGYDDRYGARPMRRIIHKEIEAVLAEMFITDQIKEGENITVTLSSDNSVMVVCHKRNQVNV